MNRRGGMFDIIIAMVVMFIVFIFFAAIIYGFGVLTTDITSITELAGTANVTTAAESTFGAINNALPALRWIALVITISLFIAILVSSFLVKAHPVFFILYILIVVVAVVFSVSLSNAYEEMLTGSNPITATLESFTAMNFIILHLPIWIVVIGIAGAIFLFIGITVDSESGGSIPI